MRLPGTRNSSLRGPHSMQKLTTYILVAMLLGIGVGHMCHELWPDPATARSISDYISLFTDIFLRLIKMIIAPLVFSTLVVGRRAHGRHQGGGAHRRQGDAAGSSPPRWCRCCSASCW